MTKEMLKQLVAQLIVHNEQLMRERDKLKERIDELKEKLRQAEARKETRSL